MRERVLNTQVWTRKENLYIQIVKHIAPTGHYLVGSPDGPQNSIGCARSIPPIDFAAIGDLFFINWIEGQTTDLSILCCYPLVLYVSCITYTHFT